MIFRIKTGFVIVAKLFLRGQLNEGKLCVDLSREMFADSGMPVFADLDVAVPRIVAQAMAFAGVEETKRLYRLAIERRYRFYSFGDAMLIL